MQYMLLIYGDEAAWRARTDDENRKLMEGYSALTTDLNTAGKLVSGNELQPIATATTLQVRDGDTVVTDGPFAETKEQLGGYYVIEAESLDDALAWAERIPDAQTGKVEIRPLVDHSGAGS